MNLRDLEYIVAVGKHRSFSYAAEVCHVSQPSLSTQIKKVEEELGLKIFTRSRRKVEITTFGAEFIERAENILSLLSEMHDLADSRNKELKGKITLGVILTVAPYILSHIVKTISDKSPSIQLVLKESTTENLVKEVLTGHLDAAIISLPTDDNIFESASLFTEAFYLAMPKDHPLTTKSVIQDEDLKGLDLILLEEGHCFRNQALDVCKTTSAFENDMFQATSLETIRHFVSAGEGLTLMPSIGIRENDGLAYRPLANPKFVREIGIIWQKSQKKRPLFTKLVELTRQSLNACNSIELVK